MKKQMLRFSWIGLENWRNFCRAETELGPRMFLIGPNASGKSNFLDSLRFLHDIVTVGGGLQEAVRRRGGVSALRCLAARSRPAIGLRVRVGSKENPELWEYEVVFREFRKGNGEKLRVERERVAGDGQEILLRPNSEDKCDPERLTQTYLEQVNVNREFRDLASFFGDVRYLHIVPQLVREPDRSVGRRNDPYGGDFLEQMAATTDRTRNARLRKIVDVLRIAVPQLQELEMWRDIRGTPHLRGRYGHWRPRGAWQTEDQFSDGTLRLLGLLWAMLDGSGTLLLEEPELSLHPEIVRRIPQMMARMHTRVGRQVLVSTHSFELLQDRGIGLDEVLLLVPGSEGTNIVSPQKLDQVRVLVDQGGMPLGEALLTHTRPDRTGQLLLFGDELWK